MSYASGPRQVWKPVRLMARTARSAWTENAWHTMPVYDTPCAARGGGSAWGGAIAREGAGAAGLTGGGGVARHSEPWGPGRGASQKAGKGRGGGGGHGGEVPFERGSLCVQHKRCMGRRGGGGGQRGTCRKPPACMHIHANVQGLGIMTHLVLWPRSVKVWFEPAGVPVGAALWPHPAPPRPRLTLRVDVSEMK